MMWVPQDSLSLSTNMYKGGYLRTGSLEDKEIEGLQSKIDESFWSMSEETAKI